MNKRIWAAMILGAIVGTGGAWGQEPAQTAVPKRTEEGVAAELQAVETEQKSLARKEAEIMDVLRTQAPMSTNFVSAAGGDEKLAAKMQKIKDLQEQLNTLKAELRMEMASNPVLQERRAKMEQRRSQLMEIQEARKNLETRKRRLMVEREAMKVPPPESTAK